MATAEQAVHDYVNDKFDRIDLAIQAGDPDQAVRILQEFADDGFPDIARQAAEEIVHIGTERLAQACIDTSDDADEA
jgi:Tfp pilus assembly protein FimV